MYEDPASYAARLRSKGEYKAAAIFECHFGEKRSFGLCPNNPNLTMAVSLVKQIPWKIPDCRKCYDFDKQDMLMYAGEIEPAWWLTNIRNNEREARQAARWSNPKILEKIEKKLLKALCHS